ncbi:putative WRB/Get1 family protein [Lupinus albus]|uniref:Putative WRB/Get1 family protein n=1 Tax=Lupinus albus TaxID=3870 RepID=A0A6A4PZH5_LUPAL|nr:putative WRB/Get1 family protein [Lupinus albus]
MGEEATQEHQWSIAAPLIFLIIAIFQFAYYWLDHLKKDGFDHAKEIQMHGEIKQLLKEASSLSQPSTFAQAAKLRRLAASKEKELAKYRNLHNKDYVLYSKLLLISKYVTYIVLVLWFWRAPVACIPRQLVQPFERLLSWRTTGAQNNDVMIGIISWLIVSARVCRFVRRAYSK